MNVVVAGATSFVGLRIAEAFSPGNDLFLIGRGAASVESAAVSCRAAGASKVVPLIQDLRRGIDPVIDALGQNKIDLVINAASATSRFRDDEISAKDVEDHLMVDLLSPLKLIEHIAGGNSTRPLRVIFLSTVLTLVKSPNRAIYTSFKILQEEYLKRLQAAHSDVRLLTVRIAKVIPTDRDVPDTAKLALAVRKAFDQDRKELSFGLSGRALAALFYTQPLVFRGAMKIQRALRGPR